MALRNILKDGEPGLLKKSRDIKDFNKRLHILLDDMRETLIQANGLGLAAPQVGVLRRAVLIVDLPDFGSDEETDTEETDIEETSQTQDNETQSGFNEEYIVELINPVILSQDGEQTGSEGCLSLPGMFGLVTRPLNVKIKAQDRNGKSFEMSASGLTARAICHEINHLDGIIFTTLAERMLTNEEIENMKNNGE